MYLSEHLIQHRDLQLKQMRPTPELVNFIFLHISQTFPVSTEP